MVSEDCVRLFHSDAQFASAEELVRETFLGRNFGWAPQERAEALRHFAGVIREDEGESADEGAAGRLPYATLLLGQDPRIPPELRLPVAFRLDVHTASDEEVLATCARLVVAYLRTLQFSRDAGGLHNGSPYDAFLAANRLPRRPAEGETPAQYGQRLAALTAALRSPRWIDDPERTLRQHGDQPFRFGEREFQGMRVFFRSAVGNAQRNGAGNCAECHVPPHFVDFRFHNTGAAQADYDAVHGEGTFAALAVPDLVSRNAEFDRWLPASTAHPLAEGRFAARPEAALPGRADLGAWNTYANPDLPAPQSALETLLNPSHVLTRDEVLARSLARFKTTTVRNLGGAAPYLHTGQVATLEDLVRFYQKMADLAHTGRLRNPPDEYFAVRLGEDDVAPLVAFLRALNEDVPEAPTLPVARGPRSLSAAGSRR